MANNEPSELTRNQSLVMDALNAAKAPMSAYTILDELRDSGFRAPLQVYRAVEKLQQMGLVHRLESLNAFVACRHPACSKHETVIFMICNTCGIANEVTDSALARRLEKISEERNFSPASSTVELLGTCATCH